jgi:hypothetical protein
VLGFSTRTSLTSMPFYEDRHLDLQRERQTQQRQEKLPWRSRLMELSLSAARAPSGAGEPLEREPVPIVSGTLGMGLTKVLPRSLSSEPTCSLLPTPRKSVTIVSLAIAQWRTGCRLGRSSVDTLPLFSSFLFSSPFLYTRTPPDQPTNYTCCC